MMEIEPIGHRNGLLVLALIAMLVASSVGHAQGSGPGWLNPVGSNLSRQETVQVKGQSVSELDPAIFYIFQATDNTYWFGSNDQGLYRYDGKSLVNFTTKDGLVSNRIRGIQQDQAGNIFVTTYEGISKFNGHAFETLSSFPSREWKDEAGDLWFVGPPDTGSVYRYDGNSLRQLVLPKTEIGEEVAARFPRSKFPNAIFRPYDVYTIFRDRQGKLWFGTASAGLCRFDGQAFQWLYEDQLTNIAGSGSFGIRSILEDKSGAFWICNTRYRFRIEAHSVLEAGNREIKYTRDEGIELKAPDGADRVYFMSAVEDQEGALWMASGNHGVWKYDGNVMTHFPVRDGAEDITVFSIYRDNIGTLWLGTHQAGVYRFNGRTFERFLP